MYRVIAEFYDLHDKEHHYGVGDEYPRPGYTPKPERIEFLAGDNTLLGHAVIEAVEGVLEASKETDKEIPAEPAETSKRGRGGRKKGDVSA